MVYNGQEVGEPGHGAEGFGGDDARTSIFDYWSMPELVKWVNGHRYDGRCLSASQTDLRIFYARLVTLMGEPAFSHGQFFGLNPANIDNERFGRLPSELASGHWLFAFLRFDPDTGQRFLVLVNLHRSETFRDVHVRFPRGALNFLQVAEHGNARCVERLCEEGAFQIDIEMRHGITLAGIPALTPYFFEISITSCRP